MKFINPLLILSLCSFLCVFSGMAQALPDRPNVLLITVDDMNWDSIGAFGSQVKNITPNIDRLASQGMKFPHAHVSIAVCWPSRAVWMTGLYPHHNGTVGFNEIFTHVKTLPEELKNGGYTIGLIGKNRHVIPSRKKVWDMLIETKDLGAGRDPGAYYKYAKSFLELANTRSKPFFLMINSHDPHRPFAGSQQERNTRKKNLIGRIASKLGIAEKLGMGKYPTPPPQFLAPENIVVLGFLPDLPDVRLELAEYYTSVNRADQTVGSVLQALHETGLTSSTLIVFLTDHGASLPFVKANTYLHSTRAGMIISWPNNIQPNTINNSLVNGTDLMPTLLEAAQLPIADTVDGESFFRILIDENSQAKRHIFTYFFKTSANNNYPMRAVQDEFFGYIYNAWSDGETVFKNEAQSGRTMQAMIRASKTNKQLADRVDFFLYRTAEEFYDYKIDPDALNNLIDNPEYLTKIREYRSILRNHLKDSKDPLYNNFNTFIKSL